MSRTGWGKAASAAVATVVAFSVSSEGAVGQTVDYHRAESLLSWNAEPLARGIVEEVEWLEASDRFWYRVRRGQEKEFVLVDPDQEEKRLLFENGRLASALTRAVDDETYDAKSLPFETFDLVDEGRVIRFEMGDDQVSCQIVAYDCTVEEAPEERRHMVASPDSTWEVFAHEHDLYVRPYGGGDTIRLTQDGEEFWEYGLTAPGPGQIRSNRKRRPNVEWSPDSRHIAVPRIDERGVEHMPLYSSTSRRPEGYTYPYALPGDSVIPQPHYYVIDIPEGDKRKVDLPDDLVRGGFAEGTDSVWSSGGDRFRLLLFTRRYDEGRLLKVDAATGEGRVRAMEALPTFVDLALGPHRDDPNWFVANGGDDVIWYSQQDGWGHLHRYGSNGEFENRITEGDWTVARLHHVDEDEQRVFFTAWGREDDEHPYHERLYGADFDGTDLQLLTPEDGVHEVEFSPSGRYFVDTYSEVDDPPVTVLREASDGQVVLELEEADIDGLLEQGWRPPEHFQAKGRDGETDIHGLMYRPSHFDPDKSYPVINWIYPGPQMGSVRSWGFTLEHWAARFQALAELGFVVLTIDHTGTPMRSKAFHDAYFGDLGDNGIADHVAVLRQLGARHDWMDLDRVGIYGNSGGGFASTRAILEYPDVFHVAVSAAGNHDNRTYSFTWGEKYHGPFKEEEGGGDSYESQANPRLAENLEGHLLLIHGDLDNNVHPAMTLQVVHALVEANKDFDLLMLPDRGHSMREPYVIRRTWDYFVRHLLDEDPPREHLIEEPAG